MRSSKPQFVTTDAWYYERARSIEFYVWRPNGIHRSCLSFRVPASMLEASLARMSPPKKRKTKTARGGR